MTSPPARNTGLQTIPAHSAGAVEYTRTVYFTDLKGNNITADNLQFSLGTDEVPGTWKSPSLQGSGQVNVGAYVDGGGQNPYGLPRSASFYQVYGQLLIDATVAAGSYWLWLKIVDSPETIPVRAYKVIVS